MRLLPIVWMAALCSFGKADEIEDLPQAAEALAPIPTLDEPDREKRAAAVWQRAVAIMDAEDAQPLHTYAFLRDSLSPLSHGAGEAVWQAYLDRVGADDGFASYWPSHADFRITLGTAPHRLAQFIDRMMPLLPRPADD